MSELSIGDGNMTVEENHIAVADGGVEVREYNDVFGTDELIRDYATPPGDRLYAYRDGDKHVVVSDGDEPRSRWEKIVPAIVERPVVGQRLWTVPDNWEQHAVSKRDSIAYGIYHVPESDVYVELSIPTNNWLVDAWYGVRAVGDFDVEPVGELGSSRDVRQLVENGSDDDPVLDALMELSLEWDVMERDLEMAVDWVRTEGFQDMRNPGHPVRANADWTIEFHYDHVFRPFDAIEDAIDVSEYETTVDEMVDELQRGELLPDLYKFQLTIDESAIDMEYYIRGLIEAGASPAESVDFFMVEAEGMTQTAWAEERGIDQSTVSGNVKHAKREIQ